MALINYEDFDIVERYRDAVTYTTHPVDITTSSGLTYTFDTTDRNLRTIHVSNPNYSSWQHPVWLDTTSDEPMSFSYEYNGTSFEIAEDLLKAASRRAMEEKLDERRAVLKIEDVEGLL